MTEEELNRTAMFKMKHGGRIAAFSENNEKICEVDDPDVFTNLLKEVRRLQAEKQKQALELMSVISQAGELEAQNARASAELRHAYRAKDDWNLVARAIEILESK